MEKVLSDITAVEAAIRNVETKMESATGEELVYYRQKEHDLRQEKHDLRQKEHALMTSSSGKH